MKNWQLLKKLRNNQLYMAKPEQFGGEHPEEITPIVTEKKEPTVDTAYSSEVQRYFNRRKAELMDREKPADEDFQYEQFLTEQQNILGKVAWTKRLEKMQPKDVAFALSELAGMMANNNLNYFGEQDSNSIVDQEKEYLEAKRLFMSTCRKMYPDIEPEKSASIAFVEAGKINKQVEMSGISIPLSEGVKLLRENPRELAKRMDGVMHILGNTMKSQAFSGFCAEDIKDVEEKEKKLGMATISYYRLQLMRDELTKQIYGRTDITHSEARQIDGARENLN